MYSNINEEKENDNKKKLLDAPLWRNLLCFVVGFLGVTLIGNVIASFFKIAYKDQTLSDELKISISAYINFFTYFILFILLIFCLGLPLFKAIFKDFKHGKKVAKGLMWGAIAMGATVTYNIIIQSIFSWVGDNANESGVNAIILSKPLLSFLMVVVLAPICEEIAYRFGLFGALYKKNRILALVLGGLIFGLIHTPFISLEIIDLIKARDVQQIWIELLNLPSYFLSGIILCLAYEKNESLVSSITAHTLNNLVAFYMTLLASTLPEAIRILFRIF